MAEKFIIASGGTGAMCARAFVYMAAAGCVSNLDTYHILLIDKDKDSDAVAACVDLLSEYNSLRNQLTDSEVLKMPRLQLVNWNFTQAIEDAYQAANPLAAGVDMSQITLRKLFGANGMDAAVSRLLHTFYTQEELDVNLDKGFYGHPNIGAVVFDYIRASFLDIPGFMDVLKSELANAKPTFLYTFGSLFGGTGASLFPNIIDALRNIQDDNGTPLGKTLVIGGALVMPYFALPPMEPDSIEALYQVVPDSNKFACQTKEALQYYHSRNLLSNMENLLLVGTKEMDITSELFARGARQHQHFHLTLLLAATACTRFFGQTLHEMAKRNYETEARDPAGIQATQALLLWKAAPTQVGVYPTLSKDEIGMTAEYRKLDAFLRFSLAIAHDMWERFSEENATINKDYLEIPATSAQQVTIKGAINKDGTLVSDQDIETFYKVPIENAGKICRSFVRFYFDVAMSGYEWNKYHARKNTSVTVVLDGEEYQANEYTIKDDELSEAAMMGVNARWVDFANLERLHDLIERPRDVANALSMDTVFEFSLLQSEAAGVPMRADATSHFDKRGNLCVGQTYIEVTQDDLGLRAGLFGSLKKLPRDLTLGNLFEAVYSRCAQ